MSRAILLAIAVSAFAAPASAQTLYRRPFETPRVITAGFDTNGSAGGCADYACGTRCYDGHTGTDFGLPVGTPVLAAATGRVVDVMTGCPDVGYNCSPCGGLCGNQVRIEHDDGSVTLYCHMQSAGMRVSVGDRVACGEVIGHSASSGCSTGPHLHFGFHASASAFADDPFRGECGGPVTRWVNQGPYSSIPAAACQCEAGAETCNGRDDDCDGSTDEGNVCEVSLLHDQPTAYAPSRTTDVDGDGRADVCARAGAGVHCWPATSDGWGPPWAAIPWSDDSGWDDVTNYATLRMGDVNGDRLADACARGNAGVFCALSTGSGFTAPAMWREGLSDASGWNQPGRYTTLRLADVDGDGKDDLCARDGEGFGCWLSTGAGFEARVEGPRWSDASGWDAAKHYGTIRMGELNGDGRADVCARSAAGVECWLSDGAGFPTAVDGPDWHGGSWGSMSHWSTIRLIDYDGDGLGDLCARVDANLECVRGTGGGFEAPVVVGELASGWDDRSNFATLRTGDLDGDGGDDLCLRANAGVICWSWDGAAFGARFDGPTWDDAGDWNNARYYETMRIADFDGDGDGDLCARGGAGWRCHASMGASFGPEVLMDALSDPDGWDGHPYWSTIRSAGHGCQAAAETCNGLDDDCDGEIDDGLSCAIDARDGGVNVRDGSVMRADGGGPVSPGGCSCCAGGAREAPLGLVIGVGLILAWRRRRP